MFSRSYVGDLIVKNDFTNVIVWVPNQKRYPWKLQFHFNEIRALLDTINVNSCHKIRSANSLVDVLVMKQGV